MLKCSDGKIAVLLHSSLQSAEVGVREAADYLSVHPETLRHWAREGELRCYKVKGRWKFRLSDLEDFIRKAYMPTRKDLREKIIAQ